MFVRIGFSDFMNKDLLKFISLKEHYWAEIVSLVQKILFQYRIF